MKSRFVFIAVLLSAVSASFGAEYTVAPSGDDANPGTESRPFRTIRQAAHAARAGDTVWVREGVYRETVSLRRSGAPDRPIRFAVRPGEKAVLQGTDPLDLEWAPHTEAIFRAPTSARFAQLFADGQMMVEARWPDMRFPGELWDRSKWAATGAGSRYGRIVDPELARTGADWTGALATLNVAHQFFTWTRAVARHSAGAEAFEYEKNLDGITSYAEKTTPWEKNRYYLSGKLEALDQPGEWFLDAAEGALYFQPPEGGSPSNSRLEAKARNFGFEARGVDHIVLQGFRFFGCTFEFLDCQSCLVEDCELLFPTFARTLSDPSMPETWASATRMTGDNNAIRRCHLAWASASSTRLLMTSTFSKATSCATTRRLRLRAISTMSVR